MAPRPRAILVLGGARSGKSAYSEALGRACHSQPIYIATGTAGDGEMANRIARHKAQRGDRWRTIEAPLDLIGALRANAAADGFILVDCVTLWISNLMFADRDVGGEVEALCAGLKELAGTVILVSNEVGLGIVPDNALARRFRDEAGLANQRLAQACKEVVLVTAGIPMTLKS
jgi:adenosylcobinamide kinase/adenosylcobinamide-phosphate guanylyltransferase